MRPLAAPARLLLGPLLAVGLLTACGSDGGDAADSASPAPPPTTTTTAPTPAPSGDRAVLPPLEGGTGKDAAPLRLTGTVVAGVEAGCLLLEADGGPYLLLGGVGPDLVGQEVTVTAREALDAVSTCQQGTALTDVVVVEGG